MKKSIFTACALSAFVAGAGLMGCSSSTTSTGGTTLFQAEVDVAVGDIDQDIVAVYLDMLANDNTNPDTTSGAPASPPAPSFILDNAGSGVSDPYALVFDGADLYVSNTNTDTIGVFRDYAGLSDGAAPDFSIDQATGLISDAFDIDVGADTLVALNSAGGNVLLFDAISTLSATQAPDAILNNGGASFLQNPTAVDIQDGALYVANGNAGAGNPLVLIYHDVSTITTDQVPDATLGEDTSFLDLGNSPQEILADSDGNLFVAAWGPSVGTQVFVFQDTENLADDDLPTAVLYGQDSMIDYPWGLASFPSVDQLVVGNGNFNTNICTGAPGLLGFGPVADLVDGQGATAHPLQEISKLGYVNRHGLVAAGGAMFAVGTINNCNAIHPFGVYVYRNLGALGLTDLTGPDIVIPGDDSMGLNSAISDAESIAANEIDSGT